MNIILWIVFGGIAGWVASIITGTDANMGMMGNILVGILGAFLGGFITDKVGVAQGARAGADRPTSILSFGVAVVGAVILILIFNAIW